MNFFRRLLRGPRAGAANHANGDAAGPIIALVGHCGPDSFSLKRFATSAADGAQVISVRSQAQLHAALEQADALLVNRALDGRFETSSGVELIQRLRAQRPNGAPAAILVSNYADAQREAEAAGAAPGFGKTDLRKPHAMQRLREALVRAGVEYTSHHET